MIDRRRMLAGAALAMLALAHRAAARQPIPFGWAEEWPLTDFARASVDFTEILSGGPPKDGIPSIDAPHFVPIAEARGAVVDREPVMSVEIGDVARAYPLSILIWHEIVNDTVAGRPIAVTYCPLCNSGVVFERIVAGAPTTFGTTGKLRHSDLVMYDRATESWWQQFDGRAIVGARTGDGLTALPARLESFAEFAERHPGGEVLAPNDPRFRDYGRNPYVGYDSAVMPFLYRGEYDGPGSPMMRVVAVAGRDEAWSFEFLRKVRHVAVGDLVIEWRDGQASALDAARVADGRSVGTVHVERRLPGGGTEPVVHSAPFAFAFRAFNPEAPIRHAE